jgi:hypothetical protein
MIDAFRDSRREQCIGGLSIKFYYNIEKLLCKVQLSLHNPAGKSPYANSALRDPDISNTRSNIASRNAAGKRGAYNTMFPDTG